MACGTTEANYNNGLGTADACHMKQTSDLVLAMAPQQVFALGDLQYNSGAPADFAVSYQNSWGRFKAITRPVVGNHEYGTSGAGGYFGYFGDAASPRQPGCVKSCDGYYSFDIGSWHIAVISSECDRLNGGTGCAVGSPQQQWLDGDLAAHATRLHRGADPPAALGVEQLRERRHPAAGRRHGRAGRGPVPRRARPQL